MPTPVLNQQHREALESACQRLISLGDFIGACRSCGWNFDMEESARNDMLNNYTNALNTPQLWGKIQR